MRSPIVVVGGGFAGFWAAAGAARAARAASRRPDITLVTPTSRLSIRPRLYESDPDATFVEFASTLDAIGVGVHLAMATHIDPRRRIVETDDGAGIEFDAAVLALGSASPLPPISGLAEHGHRIDVHHRARAFRDAFDAARRSGSVRVTVVGGGLTGIELAAELASEPDIDVTLVDGGAVGEPFGDDAADVLRAALADLGIKIVDHGRVDAVTARAAVLDTGATIGHDLLVWCGGLRANQLAGLEAFARDDLGRVLVDEQLRVAGADALWAAGDTARFVVDGEHVGPMSCQFAIPTGRLAGFNAASTLLGLEPQVLDIERYVTCIDLGRAGALLTNGWDRRPVLTGEDGKRVKEFINRTAIVPPADPEAVIAAADPAGPAEFLG